MSLIAAFARTRECQKTLANLLTFLVRCVVIDNISCPECGKKLRLLAQHRGKTVRCPACGTCFQSPFPLLESAPDPTQPRQLLPAVPPPVPQDRAIVRGAELLPDEPEPLPRPRRSTLRPIG